MGSYHLKPYSTYMSPEEAAKILPTYYSTEGEKLVCKVCAATAPTTAAMDSHLLSSHLKLLLHKTMELPKLLLRKTMELLKLLHLKVTEYLKLHHHKTMEYLRPLLPPIMVHPLLLHHNLLMEFQKHPL